MKILFLVRKNFGSGGYDASGKAGLKNSATFTAYALNKHLKIDTDVRVCVDGNSIDKEVHDFKPDVCILEAIWVTPTKLEELSKLHPSVSFIVRVHSKIAFLAMEGNAVTWIKEYSKIDGVIVGFNNTQPYFEFGNLGINVAYLPNIYNDVYDNDFEFLDYFRSTNSSRRDIKIGCFGAIRPFKNQLQQAVVSMVYADFFRLKLYFHINATRVEQRGENVLKNIRSLFEGTHHELVEHPWVEHNEFLEIIKQMDLGLQVSLTESFNIVTADFVYEKVPIIVSDDISWMPSMAKVDPSDTHTLISKIDTAFHKGKILVHKSINSLNEYNLRAINNWELFLIN